MLCNILKNDKDPYVRDRAAMALWHIADLKTAPILREMRNDPDEGVRWSVRLALRRMSFTSSDSTRAVEIDRVVRRVADTKRKGVEWVVYETKFVGKREKNVIRNFVSFMDARDYDRIKVNDLCFTEASVWAGTDKGAFRYERKVGGWVEYAVNREHIGQTVKSIQPDKSENLVFTVVIEGKDRTFTFHSKTGEWQ